jgi:hypothetical protein
MMIRFSQDLRSERGDISHPCKNPSGVHFPGLFAGCHRRPYGNMAVTGRSGGRTLRQAPYMGMAWRGLGCSCRAYQRD